jgi:hypothetical protein
MSDQEIRAKALEISALVQGPHESRILARDGKEIPNPSPVSLEKYLRLAREIEPRIREGL